MIDSLKTLVHGAALSVALALPAAAATMQAVYTGTVYNSYNTTGEFGGAAGDTYGLDGADFTATFRYDTALGTTYDGGYYQQLYGGLAYGTSSPMIYAAITINGVTKTLDLSYYNFVELYDGSSLGGTQTQTYHNVQDYFYDGLIYTQNYLDAYLGSYDGSLAVPLDLTQPFTAEFDPLNGSHYGGGYFRFIEYDYTAGAYTDFVYGYLARTRVEVTDISAVPLPAGGLLLIGGLGALALLRRRRRA